MRHLQVFSAALSALMVLSMPVYAQKTALEKIPSREARDTVTKVEIGPGRSSLIDFPQSEVIVYVVIGDRSRFTYSLDGKIGSARGIILRKIEELDFPGATESYVTNLMVTTLDQNNRKHRYFFDLVPLATSPASNGITIQPTRLRVPEALTVRSSVGTPEQTFRTWQTSLGLATPVDIRRGLEIAIARGYTTVSDPIVARVKNWVSLVENGVGAMVALEQSQFQAAVLTSLGELGLNVIQQAQPPTPPRAVPTKSVLVANHSFNVDSQTPVLLLNAYFQEAVSAPLAVELVSPEGKTVSPQLVAATDTHRTVQLENPQSGQWELRLTSERSGILSADQLEVATRSLERPVTLSPVKPLVRR